MDQLIFVAIFLLAALADLLVRWMRGKTKEPESDGELVVFEEDAESEAEREWLAQQEAAQQRLEEERAEQQQTEQRRLEQRAERQRLERKPEPVPAELPPPPIRAPALEEIVVRRPAREAAPPPPSRRRARARRWVTGPSSARQGIVLMTILGPCRGLE